MEIHQIQKQSGFMEFKRDIYLNKLIRKEKNGLIKVVTGVRRGDEIRVYPLSFKEYMSVYNVPTEEGWDDYFNYGDLPLILIYDAPEDKAYYLFSLFNKVYLSDIIDRHKIRNQEELDELVNILS